MPDTTQTSVAPVPVQETGTQPSVSAQQRGLTLRSFVVCIFALLLMGMWIEYEELYNSFGGPLAENSPPNSAVGVILILLVISAVLYRFRKQLRLAIPELIVIYAALLVAAPLMTQGMWHRIFGLLAALPHNQDFKSYESLSGVLWPHGPNLMDGRFDGDDLHGFVHAGGGTLAWEQIEWQNRDWLCPMLSNENGSRAHLAYTIHRRDANGKEVLVPGEHYLFSTLVKVDGLQSGSSYFVTMQIDDGPPRTMLLNTSNTKKSLALPGGFERIGVTPVTIPRDLRESLTLRIGLDGAGTLAVQDVQFFNSQAVEGAYTGVHVVRAKNLDALPENQRNFTVIKPDNLFSVAGLLYLIQGFIPLAQWAWPALAWTVLIAALFMGFFGLNVLMRKQWLEHERFTFPMNIFPRELFTEQTDDTGKHHLPIFRNKIMWIGFGIMMVLALLKGLHFYYPAVPSPSWADMWGGFNLGMMVDNPVLKAYLTPASVNIVFTLLAIALLVETDILFSIWVCYFLFLLYFLFGKAFNFSSIPGYPWQHEQHLGAFIGYALLAAFIGRRHLWQVGKHLMGLLKLDESEEVMPYRKAALMVLASLALIITWGLWTGMGWLAALLFFGYMLVCGFTASKIRAEAGMPFAYWMPYFGLMFVGAVGGFALFGSKGMLTATIASGFMCTSCFFLIAPVQVEMMELGRQFKVRLRDIGAGLWLGLFGGIFIGGFVFLCWAYGFGADNRVTPWPYQQNWYYNNTFRTGELAADRSFEAGTLGEIPEQQALNISKNVNAKGIAIGVGITWLLAFLRSAFVWFPLHPLGYVLAGSFFAQTMWLSCFVAWAIRSIVQRIGGAHTIRNGLVPFAVGMFLACVVSVIFWDVVGFFLRAQGATSVYCWWP